MNSYHDERRRIARQYVAAIRADTFCEVCGAQPIEWHTDNPNRRIGRLTADGYSITTITTEIAHCRALCRKCLRKIDRVIQRGPCKDCGRPIKLYALGFCQTCYMRRYYASKKAKDD